MIGAANPRISNLARLIGASGMSNLADGVFQITLPLVALTVTRDPAAFASVTLVARLPWLLVALPAGALADRLDRRRTMTLVNLGRAAIIGCLAAAVLADVGSLWPLYLAAFALGVAETLFDTAAQSILPNVVRDPDRLPAANGRLHTTELIAQQFVGPPLGAFVAAATLAGALLASSTAYLVGGALLATMAGRFRPQRAGPPTRLWADVAEGARYLLRHRLLRVLGLCVGLSNLASTAVIAMLPLYAIEPGPVGLSPGGYGLLLTTFGVGTVAGATLTPRAERRLGARRIMLLATISFPLLGLSPALTREVWWLAAGFFVIGAISISWNIITVSLRQRIVPDSILGRVNAGYRLVAWGTMPLGAALGGLVAGAYGVTATFWAAAAVSALCFPLVALGTTRAQVEARSSPGAAPIGAAP